MVPLNITIPEDFIKEEERCGYVISSKMKEVWAVEMDLLKQLQDVCSELNINYYACGGTLLGAVRHKGFIPWDDDIDVTMLRSDFEKLCKAYKKFRKPYVLQMFGNTEGYFTGHAQLRNTMTTGVLSNYSDVKCKVPYNQGIFIDIFPLDALPDDLNERSVLINNVKKYKKSAKTIYSSTEGFIKEKATFKRKVAHVIWKIFPPLFSYRRSYRKFIETCKKYNEQETEYVTMLSFMPENEKLWIKRENLKKSMVVPFEFMSIQIEEKYDEVLKLQYGEYMTPVKGGCFMVMLFLIQIYRLKNGKKEG